MNFTVLPSFKLYYASKLSTTKALVRRHFQIYDRYISGTKKKP